MNLHLTFAARLLAAVALASAAADATAAEALRPSFVVVIADDQSESTFRFMPRLAALAAAGMTFPNFFSTNPVCCPARSTLLLGQYAHNHGVLDNLGPNGGVATFRARGHEASNLATWLNQAGYRTGLFGKYLNGYGTSAETTYVPPGWSDWCAKLNQGVGYFDYAMFQNGSIVEYTSTQGVHELEALGHSAGAFVRSAALAGQPFFLWFAPFSPHAVNKEDPPLAPTAFAGIYEGLIAPRTPSFNEEDVSDKPPWLRKQELFDEERIGHVDRLYARTAEVVSGLDATVGALLDVVREQGLAESTYVFYLSDNGFQFGEHRLLGKGKAYEESVRAPLVVAGPGVTAGSVREELVANVDLAPTIMELANAVAPEEFDGRSLAPLIAGQHVGWRKGILLENWRLLSPPSDLTAVFNWRAVRSATSKLTEYEGPDESYDLEDDAFELVNLLATSAPAPEDSLWLAQLHCCRGLECRAREDAGPAPVTECSVERACADPTFDGKVSVSDAQWILSAAGSDRACPACRCDLDNDAAVTVRDALRALMAALRGSADLQCPPC